MKRGVRAGLVLAAFGVLLSFVLQTDSTEQAGTGEPKDAVTLHWFVAVEDYDKTFDPDNNVSDAKILEKTGVWLEMETGSTADLDARIATNQLPDLITVEVDAKERLILENSGMVAPLEPLFAKYAPKNQIPNSMKEWYRNRDGNWYSIASYYYGAERTNRTYGGYLGTHNNNYVRMDLLEQMGMKTEELQTKEGMLKALRAASKMKYQGQSITPYGGWNTRDIAGQFGMAVEDASGELLSPYRQKEWLEALMFGNQLYREGLMPAEQLTESVNQRRNQVAAGRIFCCSGYANVKDAKEHLKNKDVEALMYNAGALHGDAKKTPNLRSTSSGGWTATLINREADNKERIIQFIDYMTGDEGILDAAPELGAETYKIINGKYMRRDSVKEEFAQNYDRAVAKYHMNLEFFVDWTVVQRYTPGEGALRQRREYRGCTIYDSKAEDAAYWIDDKDMADRKERLDAYYQRAEIQILTAESAEQCRRLYRETLEQMDAMGLEELEEYERGLYRQAKERGGESLVETIFY